MADLGGRIEHGGILCHACNNKFGRTIDAKLSGHLRNLNGLIGIRSDRRSVPHLAYVEGSISRRPALMNLEGKQTRTKPELCHVEQAAEVGRELRTYRVSSQKQVDDEIARLRQEGKEPVTLGDIVWTKTAIFEGIRVELDLGHIDTYRAVGRQALNFLAHHDAELARSDMLRVFLDYVEGKTSNSLVWLEPNNGSDPINQLHPPPFPFGHRIILGFDVVQQSAYARVSFFDTLFYAVDFGRMPVNETKTIIYDIDPLAEKAGEGHWGPVRSESGIALCQPRIEFQDRIAHGATIDAVEHFYRRAFARRWDLLASHLVPKLEALKGTEDAERVSAIKSILLDERQRLVNLMRWAGEQMQHKFLRGDINTAIISNYYNCYTEPDLEETDHLSKRAKSFLEILEAEISKVLRRLISVGPIQSETLRSLLEGEMGRELALRRMQQV